MTVLAQAPSVPSNPFGTDGIRGTVGVEPITPDFVLRLAHAVGRVLRRSEERPTVLIGKDTRISGYMLESAMEAGLNSAGVDVVLLGPLPTPGVAYLTRAQRASLGVVISASHNPYEDNGIKFFSAQGTKLPDAWESDVSLAMQQAPQWVSAAALGRTRRLDDAAGRYIEFCKSTFAQDCSLRGLKVVVDAAHGAAWQIAPKVFHELGAEVVAIGCAPDGLNINDGFGATHPDTLAQAVRTHGADLGIALDGDADRLLMADASGRVYNGDELLYLMVQHRLERGQRVQGVVGTLMTNMAVEVALARAGVPLVRAKVGDRYVLQALHERGWLLGGESSGHLLALDRHSTGDGLISALQVLQGCVEPVAQPVAGSGHTPALGRSLHDRLQGLELFPQILRNVRMHPATDWERGAALQVALKAALKELGEAGRILIRKSGTEPLLRIMVEARDGALARQLAAQLEQAVQQDMQAAPPAV